ncbi:MAG TPA: hypothetical protein VHQ01_00105 [Pyrinomonadaceae bacterium]|nr:hypothetical protein [Pyrinomonadaceae bacterium]
MKRCPECGRNYNDDSMSFCLDDGSELLFGPASMDEPATAILRESAPFGEAATRAQIHTTDRTATLPACTGDIPVKPRGLDKRLLAAPLLLALVVLGGFFGYRYFKPAVSEQINSIAVLPLENRSGNADTDYLSDGIADSLIFRLSQLPNLKVSPTSSVMRYKGKDTDVAQIAKELEVDAVMSGRLVQVGDNLNISVQLTDARTKKLIWAEQYDRKIADLLATQREIATSITQKLQLRLAADERAITKQYTSSNEAYQLYLKGRYYWARRTPDDLRKAIDSFRQAIEIDPNFALAYAGIAEVYNSIVKQSMAAPAETIPKAKAAAMSALQIDPSLAEAHAALGDSLALYDWDWAGSEREFKRAIELDPNIGYIHLAYAATYLIAAGRMDECIRENERAVELEPLAPINNSVLISSYMLARQNDKARAQARKSADMDANFPFTRFMKGLLDSVDGRPDEAIASVRDIAPESPAGVVALVVTGFAHAKAGRKAEAEQIVSQLREISKTRRVAPCFLVWIYAAMGDKDKAIAELQHSIEERDFFLPRARVDPLMDPLRDDPRFKEVLKKMNLPE